VSRFARFDLLEKISGSGLSETWTATAFHADGSSIDVVVKRVLAEVVDGPATGEPPTRTKMRAVVPSPSRVPLIVTVLLVAGGLGCAGIAVTAAALWSFLGPTQ